MEKYALPLPKIKPQERSSACFGLPCFTESIKSESELEDKSSIAIDYVVHIGGVSDRALDR